jgi:DNA-binding protein H-NS
MTNEKVDLIKEELEKKSLSINELIALRNIIDSKIKNSQEEMQKEMIAAFRKQAEENGIPFAELAKSFTEAIEGNQKHSKTNKNPPRYANPNNPKQTWSGYGKKPDWIKTLPEGKTKDDYLINNGN